MTAALPPMSSRKWTADLNSFSPEREAAWRVLIRHYIAEDEDELRARSAKASADREERRKT